jgi:mono/diheme cytochrome c family protein
MRWLCFLALGCAAAACTPSTQPVAPPPTGADTPARRAAAVERGREVAEKWCAECHRIEVGQQSVERPEMNAPAFADTAARREVDAGYLSRFMEVQHLPMSTYRLASEERGDVVAYILSLKPGR